MRKVWSLFFVGIFGLISHPNGTGGSAPDIYQYVMVDADASNQWTGYDPHAVHGIDAVF